MVKIGRISVRVDVAAALICLGTAFVSDRICHSRIRKQKIKTRKKHQKFDQLDSVDFEQKAPADYLPEVTLTDVSAHRSHSKDGAVTENADKVNNVNIATLADGKKDLSEKKPLENHKFSPRRVVQDDKIEGLESGMQAFRSREVMGSGAKPAGSRRHTGAAADDAQAASPADGKKHIAESNPLESYRTAPHRVVQDDKIEGLESGMLAFRSREVMGSGAKPAGSRRHTGAAADDAQVASLADGKKHIAESNPLESHRTAPHRVVQDDKIEGLESGMQAFRSRDVTGSAPVQTGGAANNNGLESEIQAFRNRGVMENDLFMPGSVQTNTPVKTELSPVFDKAGQDADRQAVIRQIVNQRMDEKLGGTNVKTAADVGAPIDRSISAPQPKMQIGSLKEEIDRHKDEMDPQKKINKR